jgi:hypothetical protein
MNGPTKLATAVRPSAALGEIALEEIMVATTLLESCTPFRKSNATAKMISTISKGGIKNHLF